MTVMLRPQTADTSPSAGIGILDVNVWSPPLTREQPTPVTPTGDGDPAHHGLLSPRNNGAGPACPAANQ